MSLMRADRAPEAAAVGQAELVADEIERLQAADDHRDDDRNRRDGHVVVELADRLHERPAIGAQHQHAVGRVDQRHAGGEQGRKHQDRRERDAVGGLRRGDAEQRDLGRGVEAEPEQEADRQHVPALGHEPEQRAKDARQESAIVEQDVEIVLDEGLAALDRLKRAIDRDQNEDVEEGDREQEQRRDATCRRRRRTTSASRSCRCTSRRGEGDRDRQQKNDRGMAERKK